MCKFFKIVENVVCLAFPVMFCTTLFLGWMAFIVWLWKEFMKILAL